MALSAKKLQEVMKEKRRRDKLPPRPVIAELVPLTLKSRERNQITDRCSHVLLAIETVLVQSARDQSTIDDEIVKQGLACSIRKSPAESEAVSYVVCQLEKARPELNVSDEDWLLALRAICTSVIDHRNGKTGSFSYLIQARRFLDKANVIQQQRRLAQQE